MGGKCDYPVCPGGHYKFDNCPTEALYLLSLHGVGMYDDGQTGSTEWLFHCTLFLFDVSAQFDRKDTGMDFDVYIPAGTYVIVSTNDQGHVWSSDYPTKTEAQNVFNDIERTYSEWMGDDE